jgi:hypothetical protein
MIGPENEAFTVRSMYRKYLERLEQWEDLTYFDFLSVIDWEKGPRRWRRITRAKPRILNYFPRYSSDPRNNEFENYCRVKLMLSHAYRDPADLKTVDGSAFDTHREAYEYCQQIHAGQHPDDYYSDVIDPEPEEEFEEPEPEELQPRDWEELAHELPNRQAETEDIDVLGNRDVDLLYSWLPHIGTYPDLEDVAPDFWKLKKAEGGDVDIEQISASAPDSLNIEQRIIFDLFIRHYEAHLRGENPDPILLQVDGRGGTGKSHVIRLLSAQLDQLARAHGKESPVVRAAPTGVAANNINGGTLYSLLRLPVSKKGDINLLNATEISNLQAKLGHLLYFIIDEKSMIGLRLLAAISSRMGEVWPRHRDQFFGGRSVMLIGDFFQLPPVAERALYTSQTNVLSETAIVGRNAYRAFSRTVELKEVVRQQGPEQAAFRDALEGLRHNNPTHNQWRLLSTRVQSALTLEEVRSFDNALRIYPRNVMVNDYNLTHLEQLNKPCYAAIAENTGPRAHEVEAADAGNLHQKVPLVVGARVMLTENVWVDVGLVNGAIGTVHDIAWKTGADPKEESPFVVLVKFDRYTGPACFDRPELAGIVPIFRSRRDFLKGNQQCTRTQFPLTIAYAITVHKSQGATLDKAVLDISEKDFQPGLTYMAVSRVKTLQGVMFDTAFDLSALRVQRNPNHAARAEDIARRLPQHVTREQVDEIVPAPPALFVFADEDLYD